MKNKKTLQVKKWFAAIALFAIAATTQTVYAQCSFVTIWKSDTLKTPIPNDFPVYVNTGNTSYDDSTYYVGYTNWLASDSTISITFFTPKMKDTYIEISKNDYTNFSKVRKEDIDKMSTYYRIK